MTQESLKTQGPWEVRRELKIPSITQQKDTNALEQALMQVAGVRAMAFDPSRHRLVVRYDITETDYESIERVAEAVGFSPAGGWLARRRSKWLQNMDVSRRETAGAHH